MHVTVQPPLQPGMPAAEVVVDAALVRRLLGEQHPDLAERPLALLSEGWDNISFRLGDDLLVRLPRRAMAAPLIVYEQHWLPRLAPRLPLPVPAPVRTGAPGAGYPWPWSIAPYLPGAPVAAAPLGPGAGEGVGRFFRALHGQPLAPDAPRNPYRGGPLADRAAAFADRVRSLRASGRGTDTLERLFAAGLAAPIDAGPTWLHGDPHPLNMLSERGRLSAVIDWGDICAGDPANDLGGVWGLLPDPVERAAAFAAYGGVSGATLARARGWAAYFGAVILDSGLVNSPPHAAIGETILAALAAEA